MKLARGNMFDHPASLILVTTNSYVRSNGTLVMGRGAAAELRKHYSKAELVFGNLVRMYNQGGVYGVIIGGSYRNVTYGIFQVKYHWNNPAMPELIRTSVEQLTKLAPQFGTISLNFPGIGNGGLPRETVLPLIQSLPENVTVWEK